MAEFGAITVALTAVVVFVALEFEGVLLGALVLNPLAHNRAKVVLFFRKCEIHRCLLATNSS